MYRLIHDTALVVLVVAALGIIACDGESGCDPVAEPCVDGDGFALVEGTVTRATDGQPVAGEEVVPALCYRSEGGFASIPRRGARPGRSNRQGHYRLWLVLQDLAASSIRSSGAQRGLSP